LLPAEEEINPFLDGSALAMPVEGRKQRTLQSN